MIAGEHAGFGKAEKQFQLPLIDELWHYQNTPSALGMVERAIRTGSPKAARKPFRRSSRHLIFPRYEPID
jgi:hypothetical protein